MYPPTPAHHLCWLCSFLGLDFILFSYPLCSWPSSLYPKNFLQVLDAEAEPLGSVIWWQPCASCLIKFLHPPHPGGASLGL